MKKVSIIATSLALAVAGPAHGTLTVYTSQQAFLDAVGPTGVDTFEDFSINELTLSPVIRNGGAFGYTAAAPLGFYGAGSDADRWLSTNTSSDVITFSDFTGGISAFGGFFFGTDMAGQFIPGNITLTVTDSDGAMSQTITGATTASFLGFVSTGPLLSTALNAFEPNTNFVWATANNLTLANTLAAPAVPEPATWTMMLVGFASIGLAMRRRKSEVTASVTFA